MRLILTVQSGSLEGRQYLIQREYVLLGRSSDCHICFESKNDPGVSLRHATIELHPDGFYLVDQRSTNGTVVNGSFIQRVKLSSGDMIQLGSRGPTMVVQVETESTPPDIYRQLAPPSQQPEFAAANSAPVSSLAGRQAGALNPAAMSSFRQTMTSMAFYNPEKDKQKERSNKTVGIIAALGIGGFLALVVTLLLLSSVGIGGLIVGGTLAFLPAPFYLMMLLWMDRYDPEPAWAIAGAFAWGGLFAVFVSFIINTIFGTVAAAFVGGPVGDSLGAIISAPIIEEGSKGLGVVLLLIFLRNEFDDILDGIVYAGVIALGFATVENVLYYGRSFNQAGGVGLIFILFLRGVLSPFAHTLFTAMTGIGCGIARETHNKALKIAMPILGYFGAVFLHCLWNTIASLVGIGGFLIAYFIIWVPLFLIFFGVMIYMAKREVGIIKQMLAVEVARGLISPQQLELVGSSLSRMNWLISSLGDWKKFNARRHFLRAVTKLAFCYWHVARASAANNQTKSLPLIPKFQAEVADLKGKI
ncbi:MAG: PrsW family intramembrane metalloprotease [Blastocatellia bacterium]|nr:PrsW family intramembrane metalloprotease [Blastocatellia bacterium]